MQHNVHLPIRPEREVVVALSRIPVEPARLARARSLVGSGVDLAKVIEHATRWQVEPVVFGNLRAHFSDCIPAESLAEISELERVSRAHAVSRTLQVVDLASRVVGAGIPTIVLKGPAIAIAAYGDCSRRLFSDIDLLVRKADLPAARELLVAWGYTPEFTPEMIGPLVNGQHALDFANRAMRVEMHWSLLSRHLRFDLSPEELWREARTAQCLGSEVRVLAPHHLFLYLCAHGSKHEWMLFRWICDVAQLARRLTSEEAKIVVDLAVRTNTRRILALALRLVRETFGEEESPFPREAFSPDRETDALIAVTRARIDGLSDATPELLPPRVARVHPYLAQLTYWIRSRERKRDQIACAARFVFEPAPNDADGGALNVLMRPARLAANAFMSAVHPS